MRLKLTVLSLILGIYGFGAPKAPLSETTFYNAHAQVIFELIKSPTHERSFTFVTAGRKVGASEKSFGDRISCTIYGRSEGFPTKPSDTSHATCTVRGEFLRTRITQFPRKGGMVEMTAETAKAMMELLPGEEKIERDSSAKATLVQKEMGNVPAIHGVRCQKKSFDDPKKPTGYVCRIAWID